MWPLLLVCIMTALISAASLNQINKPSNNTLIDNRIERMAVDGQVYLNKVQAYINANTLTANTVITNSSIVSLNVTPGITYTPATCSAGSCFSATVGSDGKTVFVTAQPDSKFSPTSFNALSNGTMIAGIKSGNNVVTRSPLGQSSLSVESLTYANRPTAWSTWPDGTAIVILTKS